MKAVLRPKWLSLCFVNPWANGFGKKRWEMKGDERWWKVMKGDERWWKVMKNHLSSPFITFHHLSSPFITFHHLSFLGLAMELPIWAPVKISYCNLYGCHQFPFARVPTLKHFWSWAQRNYICTLFNHNNMFNPIHPDIWGSPKPI